MAGTDDNRFSGQGEDLRQRKLQNALLQRYGTPPRAATSGSNPIPSTPLPKPTDETCPVVHPSLLNYYKLRVESLEQMVADKNKSLDTQARELAELKERLQQFQESHQREILSLQQQLSAVASREKRHSSATDMVIQNHVRKPKSEQEIREQYLQSVRERYSARLRDQLRVSAK